MQITTKDWKKYINRMSKISQTAADLMQEWITKHGFSDDKELLDYAYALSTHYGEAIGALSCQMYEATAAAQGVIIKTAEAAATPAYGEVAKAVHGAKKQSEKLVSSAVGRLVKQVGADTTLKNAERDGAQFAWVPQGDTCAFCLMLASRGWQYMSKKALKGGHAEHIHANCDCQYAVRFDSSSTVEGYDPAKYREMYDNAEGSSSWEKINSMRKEIYNAPQNKLLRLAKDGDIFVNRSDKLHEYAKKIKPVDGYRDFVCHADEYSFAFVDKNGAECNVSAVEFCDILDKSGKYQGEPIRLVACRTGAGEAIIPKYIAKRYNTTVMAPTEAVNVDNDGNYILADDIENAKMGIETGEWKLFDKNGEVIS